MRDSIRGAPGAAPGQEIPTRPTFSTLRAGVYENVDEQMVIAKVAAANGQSVQVNNTITIFQVASAQGIGFSLITSNNLGLLDQPRDLGRREGPDHDRRRRRLRDRRSRPEREHQRHGNHGSGSRSIRRPGRPSASPRAAVMRPCSAGPGRGWNLCRRRSGDCSIGAGAIDGVAAGFQFGTGSLKPAAAKHGQDGCGQAVRSFESGHRIREGTLRDGQSDHGSGSAALFRAHRPNQRRRHSTE